MQLKKTGKCQTCKIPCIERKDFVAQTDLFSVDSEVKIKGDLSKQIIAWRDTPMLCEEHKAK